MTGSSKAIKVYLKENTEINGSGMITVATHRRKRMRSWKGPMTSLLHLKRIQNWTLKSVNKLYLNLHVLILLDMQYIGRFWTLFEAYLSFRRMSEGRPCRGEGRTFRPPFTYLDGDASHVLRSSPFTRLMRCGHAETDASKELLEKIWRGKTVQQAYQRLAMPDIHVTNQKDKLVNLKKLGRLQRLAQQPKNAQSGESFKTEVKDPEGSVDVNAWESVKRT